MTLLEFAQLAEQQIVLRIADDRRRLLVIPAVVLPDLLTELLGSLGGIVPVGHK